MEKNPVSLLHELMIKRGITPIYTTITEITGSQIISFKIRVQCGDYFGNGKGMSKKEAKANAAKDLLKNVNNPNTSLIYDLNVGINYIGKLQENAMKQCIPVPEYIFKTMTGPMHIPLFTVICKYQNLEEEAIGKTKKEAKNLAAKKVFNRISKNEIHIEKEVDSFFKTLPDQFLHLKINTQNQSSLEKSATKAMKLYTTPSKTVVNKKDAISGYHTFLRDSASAEQRQITIDKLNNTICVCKNYSSFNDNTQKPMTLLKNALQILNINVVQRDHYYSDMYSVFSLELDTNPVIKELGVGKNKQRAEILAVSQLAQTVSVMLY